MCEKTPAILLLYMVEGRRSKKSSAQGRFEKKHGPRNQPQDAQQAHRTAHTSLPAFLRDLAYAFSREDTLEEDVVDAAEAALE